MNKSETGKYGETVAVEYLLQHGFTIMNRNWRHGRYELDVIARKGDTVHFVEVKCRRYRSLCPPEQALDRRKFSALQTAATAFIEANGITGEIQFDVIAVEYKPGGDTLVRYLPDALRCSW